MKLHNLLLLVLLFVNVVIVSFWNGLFRCTVAFVWLWVERSEVRFLVSSSDFRKIRSTRGNFCAGNKEIPNVSSLEVGREWWLDDCVVVGQSVVECVSRSVGQTLVGQTLLFRASVCIDTWISWRLSLITLTVTGGLSTSCIYFPTDNSRPRHFVICQVLKLRT